MEFYKKIINEINSHSENDLAKKYYFLTHIIKAIEEMGWEKDFFKTQDEIVKERVENFIKLRDQYGEILFPK